MVWVSSSGPGGRGRSLEPTASARAEAAGGGGGLSGDAGTGGGGAVGGGSAGGHGVTRTTSLYCCWAAAGLEAAATLDEVASVSIAELREHLPYHEKESFEARPLPCNGQGAVQGAWRFLERTPSSRPLNPPCDSKTAGVRWMGTAGPHPSAGRKRPRPKWAEWPSARGPATGRPKSIRKAPAGRCPPSSLRF